MAASQVFVGLKEKHMGPPTLSVLICKMGIITRHWVPLDSHNMEGAGPRGCSPGLGRGGEAQWESGPGFPGDPHPIRQALLSDNTGPVKGEMSVQHKQGERALGWYEWEGP